MFIEGGEGMNPTPLGVEFSGDRSAVNISPLRGERLSSLGAINIQPLRGCRLRIHSTPG